MENGWVLRISELPTCVLHADWSVHPYKRQMAAAWLEPNGSYTAHAPISVPNPALLLPELRATIGPSGCALIGFDFPIGLPIIYAQKTGVTDFTTALGKFGQGKWMDFYQVAKTPADISLFRPFYPARPGYAAQSHLLQGLGVDHIDQLRRVCELAKANRRAAAPIFWTLGGQQVGKAAISGWRDVLAPALKNQPQHFRLWPFHGSLPDLLRPGTITAAETYPAEFYTPLQVTFSTRRRGQKSGKRSLVDRLANADNLMDLAARLDIQLSSELENTIRAGFGAALQAEDAFDAVVGLLGMFMVVRGQLPASVHLPVPIANVEGWILGQETRSADLKL
jgi:hypothetical protein